MCSRCAVTASLFCFCRLSSNAVTQTEYLNRNIHCPKTISFHTFPLTMLSTRIPCYIFPMKGPVRNGRRKTTIFWNRHGWVKSECLVKVTQGYISFIIMPTSQATMFTFQFVSDAHVIISSKRRGWSGDRWKSTEKMFVIFSFRG